MYNRYIPQPDGSYKRNRMPDTQPQQHIPRQKAPQRPQPDIPKEPAPCPPPPPAPKNRCPRQRSKEDNTGITGFFKQLLPKDLDTADLMIILLLLLMCGDSEESKNNALLTLALYFFM